MLSFDSGHKKRAFAVLMAFGVCLPVQAHFPSFLEGRSLKRYERGNPVITETNALRQKTMFVVPSLFLIFGFLALLAFGFAGVGRPGSYAFDMPYLFTAGEMWESRLSPYELNNFQLHMEPVAGADSGSYAYPPNSAPLAFFLSLGSLDFAKSSIGALNVASLLFLVFFIYSGAKRSAQFSNGESDNADLPNVVMAAAVVIGNPFTAHVVWMGQTTLISAAFLMGSWLLADRRRDVLAGVLLGLAAFKPQLAFLVGFWFLLDRRWLLLVTAAVSTLVVSLWPMITSGIEGSWIGWVRSLIEYQGSAHNVATSKHVFGLRSLFATFDLVVPSLMPIALVCIFFLHRQRAHYENTWIIAAVLLLSFLLVYAHDYDIAAATIVAYPLLRAAKGNTLLYLVIALLGMILFFPQRLWERFELEELARARELAVLSTLFLYLAVCRLPQASSINRFAFGKSRAPS